MSRFAACFGLLLCLGPSIASAALSLQIGPMNGPFDDAVHPPFGQRFLDLVFHETGSVQREGLFTYDIALDFFGPPGSEDSVSFVSGPGTTPVQIGPNPAIAMTPNPASITILESAPRRLVFNITSGNDLTDIDEGESAARIFYTFSPDAPLGLYRIRFDTVNTVFGSGDPELPLSIEVALTDEGVFGVPEPSGLAVLGVAGVVALRRRGRVRKGPPAPPAS